MVVFCSSLISRFPVRWSGNLWITFGQFQSPVLLPASLPFHTPHALYFHCKLFTFRTFSAPFFITFPSPPITTVITDRDVRFAVRDSSVGPHMSVPQYGYLTDIVCLYWCRYMVILLFVLTSVHGHTAVCTDVGTWSYCCLYWCRYMVIIE
jgi:hypothetical protein